MPHDDKIIAKMPYDEKTTAEMPHNDKIIADRCYMIAKLLQTDAT
jgi:hypothetical protein